jgi:predicted MFS family arabinose efflux permease
MTDKGEHASAAHVSRYGAYVIGIVMFSFLLSFLDRQVLTLLLQPIKNEFGVSDTTLGLLTGFAFVTFYAILGVPISRLADRTSRPLILAVSIGVWSLATVASGLSTTFSQLVVARIFLALGEAGFSPVATSLIADYAPPHRRATAIGLANSGFSLGVMAGFLIGAYGIHWQGWRGVFLIAGVPGLVIALLFWMTVREPRQASRSADGADGRARETVAAALALLWKRRSYRYIIAANCLSAIAVFGLSSWLPTFLVRSFPQDAHRIGYILAPAFGIAGTVGVVLGGLISDRFSAVKAGRGLWLCAGVCIPIIPLLWASISAPTLMSAAVVYSVAYCMGTIYAGPTMATICRVVPERNRAFALGLSMYTLNLVGLGVGPLFIGVVSDRMGGGRDGLQLGMLLEAFVYVPAAACYFLASRSLDADVSDIERVTSASADQNLVISSDAASVPLR